MSASLEIPIQEVYRNYQPPFDVRSLVRKLLRAAPVEHLGGLSHVVLTNNPRTAHRDQAASNPTSNEERRVLGRYHLWRRNTPPYIELRVDEISAQLDRLSLHIPILREIAFGSVLFHEVGHHLQLKHHLVRPDLIASEALADNYCGQLLVTALEKHYRYAMFLQAPALWAYRLMRRL